MKLFIYFLYCLAALSLFSDSIRAQTNKTIILVRHAEKAAATEMDKGDPDLSADGKQRAERLMKAIKKYKPHEIFATDYKRTRQTAEPIASYHKKQILTYDPAKSADFIQKMMASKTDHYLIIGHSNSIPALANLLAKKEIFRQMPDSEFGVIWIIRFKRGVFKNVEIITY